jgi:hypothetical protein
MNAVRATVLVVLLPLSALAAAAPVAVSNLNGVPHPHEVGAGSPGTNFQQSQSGFGKLDPSPLPDGLTTEALIKKFGERESAFAKARDEFTFRQTVRVNTIDDDTNKPDGEYLQVTDIVLDDKDRRTELVKFAPANTITKVMMTQADFDDIAHRLPFVLTTPELPQYDLTYLGRQKVDDLDTYVFDCAPKTLVKGKRYFQGKVWVDQQDNEIVLINGLTVPQDTRAGHEDLSPPYTTYYQQIDGKYWFPVYTKAEGTLHFAAQHGALSQDVHVKTTVRYTDYKRFRTSVTIHYNGEDLPNADAPTAPAADKPKPPPQ